ncbi:MAG: PilN domain-containing protein [Xanthomonadales bacterium]|nr:PilN domain-containing protein [Xanthomonadales bacterium]
MTSIAAQSLQKLKTSRTVSGGLTFLQWWRDQLVEGLPPRIRKFFEHREERLLARMADDEVLLWRDGNGGEKLGRFRVGDEEDIGRQVVMSALARFEEGRPPSWFLIDHANVLVRTISMPAAAEDNLRQVLQFEMDRHTPFTAEQAAFDYRIVERRPETRQLGVELVAAPQKLVDRVVKIATDRGLQLDGIDICRERNDGVLAVLGLNLLPTRLRAPRSRRSLVINLMLAALAVLLLYLVMWQSLAAREKAAETFAEESNRSRAQAQQVAKLRDQLSEARSAALFLSRKKSEHPVAINVLKEVTRVLPDDVWVQRFQITKDKVQLTGQAPDAAAIIELLQDANCLGNALPKGAFTPDSRTGKERFTVEMNMLCNGTDNQSDTADGSDQGTGDDGPAATG